MKTVLSMILSLFLALPLLAGTNKTVPEKKTEWLNDQNDQTDIYAIPFDDSEAEEESEEKELERRETREKEYIDAHPHVKGPNPTQNPLK